MTDGSDFMPVEYLTDAFVARQGLDRDKARRLADQILAGDVDVARAAGIWASTGVMPDEPEVAGHSPAGLAASLTPSQVFTGLQALRLNPSVALNVLRHPPHDAHGQARAWEQRVHEALKGLADVAVVVEPLGPDRHSRPDFLVELSGKKFVVEAKALPASPGRVRPWIERVERYVLVFQAVAGIIVVPRVEDSARLDPGYLAPVFVTDLAHLDRTFTAASSVARSARR